MLRESSRITEDDVNLADVTAGLGDGTRIPEAESLVGLAEAMVARDAAATASAREALRTALGDAAAADSAATVAAFHGFVRLADATGIPYTTAAGGQDVPDIRAEAGVDGFYRVRGES